MHFALNDEEAMIRDAARRIARQAIAPLAEKLDRGEGREQFRDNLKLLAENGFMTLNVRGEYGGSEAGTVAFALAIEEIGYACAATGVTGSPRDRPSPTCRLDLLAILQRAGEEMK